MNASPTRGLAAWSLAALAAFDIPQLEGMEVDPVVPVVVEADDAATRITANFPKVSHVRFGWTDSRPVPEQNIRMNGEGYYAVAAEEGGLRVTAQFEFDVISGKAREATFRWPEAGSSCGASTGLLAGPCSV